jgi:hypothetical protein
MALEPLMRPTPDDYAEARRLLASTFEGTAADGPPTGKHFHDYDEELGMYWYDNPAKGLLDPSRTRHRDEAYWLETGSLVREYLVLQAGVDYSDMLRQGFIAWLKRSPGERRQYVDGDDMRRAALVDWFLKVVR